MARIVLAPHAGGLGDALLYSTLPECYARRGDEVWISEAVPARNPEVVELVWRHNPFIVGFLAEGGNVGGNHVLSFVRAIKGDSPIQRMERVHGFPGLHTLPVVAYRPRFRKEYRDAVLCDPTSISQSFPRPVFEHFVAYHARNRHFAVGEVIVVGSRYAGDSGQDTLADNPHLIVRDIYELCDLIFSCRIFLCGDSGCNSLAAAIKGTGATPDVICLTTTMSFNDQLFTYPNVHYSVSGQLSPDYKEW